MDKGTACGNGEWTPTKAETECSPLSPTSSAGTTDRKYSHTRNNQEQDYCQPLCSVLNTVIDYVMKPPTALESEDLLGHIHSESQWTRDKSTHEQSHTNGNNTPLLVPVIRVFGPILRRQNLLPLHPPAQSACLHIHGAFPYLLARPCVAGPDGSLHQNVNAREANMHLDWDDPAAVERFLPILKTNLEDSIQLSQASWAGSNNNNNGSGHQNSMTSSKNNQPKIPVIRRLSVVMGRGFYTYCPGPPAPFVRVEYYNPSDRWKVKRALEKGLDSLPLFYHPDPFQYDPFGRTAQLRRTLAPPGEEDEDELLNDSLLDGEIPEALQFHCYEAHIPYTMQFFKDWNLAGMSYIHVGQRAFFRQPLPESIRDSCVQQDATTEPCDNQNVSSAVPSDYLFLRSNTPNGLLWPNEQQSNGAVGEVEPLESHLYRATDAESPVPRLSLGQSPLCENGKFQSKPMEKASHPQLEKDTSCDVELDISVDQIMNIFDVMKTLPEDKEERARIHWRAVPSLREIWKQERLRMSTLLPPENDFLSNDTQQNKPPPFTLSVKGKDTPMPGSQLAVEGMQRLLRVSDGLEENYRRAMKEIVERYSEQVDWIDRRLKNQVQTTPGPSSTQTVLTPTFDEAISALQQLGEEEVEAEERNDLEYDTFQVRDQHSLADDPNQRSAEIFFKSTESYYNPLKRIAGQEPADDFLLSQLVEQGESVVQGPFEHMDDFIDPETLRPYETLDDGDSIVNADFNDDQLTQEESLEKELSVMATQTLELGKEESFDRVEDEMSLSADEETMDCPTSDLYSRANEDCSHTEPTNAPDGNDAGQASDGAKAVPPIRKDVALATISTRLLPMPQKRETPKWTKHLVTYKANRKSWAKSSHSHQWFSCVGGDNGGNVSLTRCPPSRRSVLSWLSKQLKKRDGEGLGEKGSRKKARVDMVPLGTKDTDHLAALVVDGNSRKLVADEKPEANENIVFDKIQGRQVEEVDWCHSQTMTQSETPKPVDKKSDMHDIVDTGEKQNSQTSVTQLARDDLSSSISRTTPLSMAPSIGGALDGIGQQGGKLWVEAGGRLKAEIKPSENVDSYNLPTPLTVMSIEVHIQCRTGRASVNDSKQISMVPDSERDPVSAVVYTVANDPGGGESLEFKERGVIFVPNENEINCDDKNGRKAKLADTLRRAVPRQTMGISSPFVAECVIDERSLLFRLARKVQITDPDMLISWDTQGSGIGYLLERGAALSRSSHDGDAKTEIDMVKLLGRCRKSIGQRRSSELDDVFGDSTTSEVPSKITDRNQWKGSGLGSEWDERVGAGAAAASISGRLVFAAWKIVAEEVKHANASYQPAVVAAVLGFRIPFHGDLRLTQWYGHDAGRERWRVVHHRLVQATASLLLFDALDIIGRAGEAARLSGVEFSQSFPGIRGSQYKVEGVLLRALQSLNSAERGSKKGKRPNVPTESSSSVDLFSLSDSTKSQTQSPWKARRQAAYRSNMSNKDSTKPLHDLNERAYFFYSPSLRDTDRQEALEVQALTLEPESAHYEDPIVVCDFTALYPSLVIAYNLCYSTCAGKTTGKLGPFVYPEGKTATILKHHMKSLGLDHHENDRMYVGPTGTMYVSESVVKGVLPQVLDEMLSTRAMLKKASKEYKRLVPNLSPSILRQLEARQLALKYVANVTYGYTSATFSGRCAMPLLADTIVECGRRTLKNAINLANRWGSDLNNKWTGCKVLYGDTDSVFVKLPGRSVAEAFRFGEEFCKAVTAKNPPPVQLKLEKVYLGSILQTKKKYCGMKFESVKQPKPTFEAKGLETVRRDQCALTQKILRNSLVTLFSKGTAAVRRYLFRQWSLILSGELPVSDFILTGRVRSRYRGNGVGPVQAVLARRLAEADPGRVMRHKERIAFVIVATPGRTFRLRDGVLTPNELLEQWDAYVLNTTYYITKHVNPSLQRCLGLAPHFIDVTSWYNSMPKPRRRIHFWPTTITGSVGSLSRFFANSICLFCGGKGTVQGASKVAVCDGCKANELASVSLAFGRLNLAQEEAHSLAQQCGKCHLGYEDASTYATIRPPRKKKPSSINSIYTHPGVFTPLASCSCIDCPVTFKRHRLRESEYEATELCRALVDDDF
ncbi:hypothetical protein ACA910_014590 [Epithemia clementina (nom. ined.)]